MPVARVFDKSQYRPALIRYVFKMEDWRPIETAPFDQDLQLAVIESDSVYALSFACRRTDFGWVNAQTRKGVLVEPTHWCMWLPK
jgi:hypothetical protein